MHNLQTHIEFFFNYLSKKKIKNSISVLYTNV